MCSITIWKKLFINTVTTDTVYLFSRVFFDFFQKFLRDNGILAQLEELGCVDGDTVRMYFLEFDYYK